MRGGGEVYQRLKETKVVVRVPPLLSLFGHICHSEYCSALLVSLFRIVSPFLSQLPALPLSSLDNLCSVTSFLTFFLCSSGFVYLPLPTVCPRAVHITCGIFLYAYVLLHITPVSLRCLFFLLFVALRCCSPLPSTLFCFFFLCCISPSSPHILLCTACPPLFSLLSLSSLLGKGYRFFVFV